MIMLTKLNGVNFALNDEMIETMYENPDTTIHLANGIIYIVQESMEDIIREIVAFRYLCTQEVLAKSIQEH